MKTNQSKQHLLSVLCQLTLFWVFIYGTAHGSSLNWTNTAGGNWSVAENWDPNQVPAAGDTALITNSGNYTVTVDAGYFSLDSLAVGGDGGGQLLAVSGGQIVCNGAITVGPGDSLTVSQAWVQAAQVNIAGTVNWDSGSIAGVVTVATNGVLNLTGDNEKFFNDGSAITNYGTIHWSGQGAISASDDAFTPGSAAVINMAGGVFEIQSDATFQVAPWSLFYNSTATVVFHNAGTLRKTGGPGATTFSNVSFQNSGTVEVQQGTFFFSGYNGSHLTSSGLFQVNSGAAVRLDSGTFDFLPGHLAQGPGYFGLTVGGMRTFSGIVAGKLDWAEGSFSGQLTIATNGVLNITGDTEKFLNENAAITNYGAVYWSGQGAISASDDAFTPGSPAVINMAGGTIEIQGDATLQVAPWSLFYNPTATVVFQNAGTLRKTGGPGATTFSNVTFQNSGTVEVQQGSLFFSGYNGGHLTSSGLFQVNSGAAVRLDSGTFDFLPGHLAQGPGYFGLTVGGMRTFSGIVAGKLDWAEGSFSGQLTIATNGVLNITGDNEKFLEENAALTNYGAVYWSGQGAISASDDAFTPGSAAVINMAGGIFEIQGDATLQVAPWSLFYNSTATVVFQNAGTLRKTGGPGATTFSNVTFQNSGTVEVQQGSLFFSGYNGGHLTSSGLFQVNSGAAVRLDSGTFDFLPGHLAQGPGYFGLTVGGMRTFSGIVAGRLDWAEGSLSGQLTIAINGVLNITGDNEKFLNENAAITNYGAVYWSGQGVISASDDAFTPGSPAVINMVGGTIEIQSDATLQVAPWSLFYNPTATVAFQNAGTLRKTGGPGATTFSNVTFENSGTVDVQQGTLFFSGYNGSHLTSSGLFRVNSGAAVRLDSGTFDFFPGHLAQGPGYFGLTVGGMRTFSGIVAGKLDWAEGSFSGQLTIATNGVLNITGDNEKFLDENAALTNYGAVYWSGQGTISASDDAFTPGSAALVNMVGGIFEIQSDATLQVAPWSLFYNPTATVVLQNAGTLRKVSGLGATSLNQVQLLNSGSLEIWSGSLAMDSGSAWVNSGTLTLTVSSAAAYTRVQTAGTAQVGGSLNAEFLNGFLPAADDAFEFLTYQSTNILFANISLPALPAGQYFSTLIDTQHLVVETRQDPIANPDYFSVVEDTPAELDVLANDNHLYGTGTIVSFTQPAHGQLASTATHTLIYVPALNFFGSDGFSYQARNADGRFASANVTLTITPVNDPPLLAPVADQTVNEQTVLNVQAMATDVENDEISFSLAAGAPAGASVHPVTGLFTWTPSEAQGPGNYAITLIATDNGNPPQSSGRTFNVTVREVNTAPVLAAQADRTIVELQPLSLQLSATDADLPANTLTFNLLSGPAGLSVSDSGLVAWTPTEAQGPSTNVVTVAVVDNGTPSLGATQSFQLTVTEANSAPVLPGQTNLTINELTLLIVTNTATDSDLPANTLNYTLLNAPTGASIDTNGVITWTPTEAQGPSSNLLVTVVTDNGSPTLSSTNSFSVIVNEVNTAPVLTSQANRSIVELQSFSLQLAATDSDLPANTLTFSLVSGPAGLSVTGNGLLSWTPTELQGPGVNLVTVAVTDDGAPSLSATQSFSIMVLEANSAPVLPPQANRTINELTLLTVTNTATDSDLPANTLSYALLNAPIGAAIDTDGLITWTPAEAQGPSSNLLVTVVTDNGSPTLSSTNSFSVIVTEVNSAPVLTPQADRTIVESQAFALILTATDSDLPANTLTFSLVSGPAGLSLTGNDLLTWTPTESQGPSVNLVTVAVTDNGTPSLSATQSFTLTVTETNSAPDLPPQGNRTINELSLLTVTNTATDSDLPANTLTYALLNAPTGATIDTNGVITWTPAEDQGPSSNLFVTVVTDNGSPALSTTNAFTVFVNEVNSPPVLPFQSNLTINELTTLSVTNAATDPDIPGNTLTYSLLNAPAGALVQGNGRITWSPGEAQGPSTNLFVLVVTDNGFPSMSATNTFTVTINEVNQAPVLNPIATQTINELTPLYLQLSASDADLPANLLTFGLSSGPPGLSVTPSGALSWTPSEAQGPTTNPVVVFVADNGSPSLSATQSFSIVVREVNTAPILAAISDQIVSPAQTLSLTFSASDSDVPANTLTFSLDAAPAGASVSASGQFGWTPTFAQAGTTNTVAVRVTDNGAPALNATRNFVIVVPATGLHADYFTGTNFNTLAMTRTDAQVDFAWPGSPGAGVSADQFSVRWTGRIIPRYSQTYTFSTISDDGVRLWVNGFLVIDNWTVHLATTNTGTIALTAGQSYPIKLEYFDGTGSSVCRLRWTSSSQALEAVPTSQLLCTGYSNVIPSAIYRFTPKLATTKSIEAKSGGTADGTEATINNWNAQNWQKWQAIDVGGGYFKLIPQHATTKVLEINGGFTTNGTKVQISTATGSARQCFQFVDQGQGWFELQPQSAPGSLLQLKGGNTGNGTSVELFQDNNTDPQRWRLDRQ